MVQKDPASKLTAIFYSLFGLIISSLTYIRIGATILNVYKLTVVLIEVKLSKEKNKRRVSHLYSKIFLFNFISLLLVILVASLTTLSLSRNGAGNENNLLDHVTFWCFNILTITGKSSESYFLKLGNNTTSKVVLCLFTAIGISFLSSTVWNVTQGYQRIKNNNKRTHKQNYCFCCCFGNHGDSGEGAEGLQFKDVGTQKWGSLMSINNASHIELRSIDGNVFENSNRVDSQCTIKRLSEYERDRGHRGNGGDSCSDSEVGNNEADDELDVLSPIMVTAAVATRRTVTDIN